MFDHEGIGLVKNEVVHIPKLDLPPLEDLVDLDLERQRLGKEIEKTQGEIKRVEGKLSNQSFLAKAPEPVVNTEREKLDRFQGILASLEERLASLNV